MPGVVISTAVRTGPSSATTRESSQLFVVGMAERGPSDEAVAVESLADFELKYGGYLSTSYLHPTVEAFFEEGGTRAYVSRAVGPSASNGTLACSGIGSASATTILTLDASGPGTWSSSVAATIEHVTASVSFRVKLYYGGDIVYNTGTVTSVAQAAGRINTSPLASAYVTATALAGATSIPVAITNQSLTSGDSDHGNVTSSTYVDALDMFVDSLGTGAVCVPDAETSTGTSTYTVSEALIAHANEYNRIAIIHGGVGDSTNQIKSKALALQAEDHAEHAAIYYPWVDAPTSVAGVTRRIPPDGYVAAKRALAHNVTGPHAPAAGLQSASRFISGVASTIDKTVGDDLDESNVNAIRLIQNTVRIYGARSLSSDDSNFRYITAQDVVNSVVVEANRSLEDLVFATIDGTNRIYSDVASRLAGICKRHADLGALFTARDANGTAIDDGYTVRCDAALNPVSQLAGGTIKARVGLRVSSVGDKINVDIIKSNLTASVVQ